MPRREAKSLRPEPVRKGPFAEWLSKGRRNTVQEIADRLDVTRAHVNGLLNGTRRPSLKLALAIEEYTKGGVPASAWGNQ